MTIPNFYDLNDRLDELYLTTKDVEYGDEFDIEGFLNHSPEDAQ